jgi:hypothetical protein
MPLLSMTFKVNRSVFPYQKIHVDGKHDGGWATHISYDDEKGRWHTETDGDTGRPSTRIEG